jgi:HPt (histidine-containing phosphotransfer) domain-containing protein
MTETTFNQLIPTPISAGQPVESDQVEILDYQALIERCLGNLELAGRLIDKLQSCLPQEIEGMEQALADQDSEQVARIAHRLKGATASVSAQGLNRVLEEIEQFGRAGVLSVIPASLERLRGEWEQFKDYSAQVLSQRKTL